MFVKLFYKEENAFKETYINLQEISHVVHSCKTDKEEEGKEYHYFTLYMHNGAKLNVTRESWDKVAQILDKYIE